MIRIFDLFIKKLSILFPLKILSLSTMDGKTRSDIKPGMLVAIILKKDQRSGATTEGIVKDLLTSSAFHGRGIKVRLTDGQIGRVVEILED